VLNGGVDLLGCEYVAIRAQPWERLREAIERALGPAAKAKPTDAELAMLRDVAQNYRTYGSDREGRAAYGYYRRRELDGTGNAVDWLVYLTTGFGANRSRIFLWWIGAVIVPWALVWRPQAIVRASEDAPAKNMEIWINQFCKTPASGDLHAALLTLAFSASTFAPGIEFVGFKRWTASDEFVIKGIPLRYTTVATAQRLAGWVLIPLGVAGLAGFFGV
jgi:hypothetical protein